MPKMQKHELMRDLIAGALSKDQMLELIATLEKMGKNSDDNGNCDFVAEQLRIGYYNWTGEQIDA